MRIVSAQVHSDNLSDVSTIQMAFRSTFPRRERGIHRIQRHFSLVDENPSEDRPAPFKTERALLTGASRYRGQPLFRNNYATRPKYADTWSALGREGFF